jgi:hypothetical protein
MALNDDHLEMLGARDTNPGIARTWNTVRWNGHQFVPEAEFTSEPAVLVVWPFSTHNVPSVSTNTRCVLVIVGSPHYRAALQIVACDPVTFSFIIPGEMNPQLHCYSSPHNQMMLVSQEPRPPIRFRHGRRGDAMRLDSVTPVAIPVPLPPFARRNTDVELPRRSTNAPTVTEFVKQEAKAMQAHLIRISLFLPKENRYEQLKTLSDVLVTWCNEIIPIVEKVPSETECPVCEEKEVPMVVCPNGHHTCESCYDSLLNIICPECRNPDLFKCTSDPKPIQSVYSSEDELKALINRVTTSTLSENAHRFLTT